EGYQIKVRKIPVKVIDLVFKHYQYHYRVRNLFNNNLMLLDRDVIPKELETRPDFNFEDPGTLDLTVVEHRRKTFENNPETWFRILYRDVSDNYTTRIIRTIGVYDLEIGNK